MGQACCAERDYFNNSEYLNQPINNISSPRQLQTIDPAIIMKLNQVPPYKFTNINGLDRGVMREVQKLPSINCYYKG
jgi:hypothetical protein